MGIYTRLQALKPDTDTINRLQDQIARAFDSTQSALTSLSQSISALSLKSVSYKFSGFSHPSFVSYLFDSPNSSSSNPIRYALPASSVISLRVVPLTNTATTPTDVTLYKNNQPTALKITIPAGSTLVTYIDTAHSVPLNGTSDTIDLVLGMTPSGIGAITVSATIGVI